ncbi:hypothetical protein SAMN02745146_3330 [Hymenobacter daecheongensis DSM 21074]|uniref:Uncharacterized protein n=1 Tax=Hymenobacter daecheongensis DSM 21074 TaxID=1121955 RepID=A0A1M6JZ80_9BACT|nr:hypothetical protein [Hymenobacter daecheongensis]SHJ52006.1 hypothetical protein SAMN02745146_3330 [Hymenobacter daecheongensis DSM 21074]
MMKRIFPVLLLFSALAAHAQAPATPAQPDPLAPLIQERGRMVQAYEDANAQRNSLFGNKPSKKDLQEVVDVLKAIIRKDTEIVQALKESSIRRTASIVAEKTQAEQQITVARGDQSMTREKFYDLENQIQNLQIRDKQREKKLAEAQATAQEAAEARTSRELLATALAVLCAGLLWYIYKLRGQVRPVRGRR